MVEVIFKGIIPVIIAAFLVWAYVMMAFIPRGTNNEIGVFENSGETHSHVTGEKDHEH